MKKILLLCLVLSFAASNAQVKTLPLDTAQVYGMRSNQFLLNPNSYALYQLMFNSNASNSGGGGAIMTPTYSTSSIVGLITVPSGFRFLSIANTSNVAGLFNGISLPANTVVTLPYDVNNTYASVTYNPNGATFFILIIR